MINREIRSRIAQETLAIMEAGGYENALGNYVDIADALGRAKAGTVHYKGEAPLNVALIDMDEGFRLMSRVEDIDAMDVKIGMRVKFRTHPGDDKQPPYPVFTPTEGAK